MSSELVFAVAANFTAEPVGAPLRFWIDRLSLGDIRVEFAGYNQVFHELISPTSLFASSDRGVNLLLIRLEDWGRSQTEALRPQTIASATRDFLSAFEEFNRRARRPTILLLCPPSQDTPADPELAQLLGSLERNIRDSLAVQSGALVFTADQLATFYRVESIEDPESNRQGHVPFTPAYWTAIGTFLARRARVFLQPARKVIAVDADNTLWGGVAAESGAGQVDIAGPWHRIQDFLIGQKRQGMLLALVSKNRFEDVEAVFQRPDMQLRREDFVAWKVNWKPKSENLYELAAELELGLDSFVFLDDNPVECAEVKAHCPAVTVLPLPSPESAASFLKHAWVFDLPPMTSADAKRTEQYRRQAERKQVLSGASSFAEFIQKLELCIELSPPAPEQIERAAQLTQRTNQFNTTGLRRTAAELTSLLASGKRHALLARVKDRFGDYGDVGLCVYSLQNDSLEVDNFVLSCRVLGKGVEHQLLAALGRIASELNKKYVAVPFRRTDRNEPAARFLGSIDCGVHKGESYYFPAAEAMAVIFNPAIVQRSPASAEPSAPEDSPAAFCDFAEIARNLTTVPEIQLAIRRRYARIRPELATAFVPPHNSVEQKLADIWADVLGLDRVGILDNFFDLGGDSVQSIQILSKSTQAGFRLTLTQHFQFPVIAQQAPLVTATGIPAAAESAAASVLTPSSERFPLARLGKTSMDAVLAHVAKTRN